MKKTVLTTALTSAMMVVFAPTSHADVVDSSFFDQLQNKSAEELILQEMEYGGGYVPYDYSSINFYLTLSAKAQADDLNVSADYSAYGSSRREVLDSLNQAADDLQAQLQNEASVSVSYLNVYQDYPYYAEESTLEGPQSFNGYVNVMIDPFENDSLEAIKETLNLSGFNHWVNVVLSEKTKIEVESSVAPELKELISDKKKTYETILGEELTTITSLYIDTYADANTYDPDTNTVTVNVNANVGYNR